MKTDQDGSTRRTRIMRLVVVDCDHLRLRVIVHAVDMYAETRTDSSLGSERQRTDSFREERDLLRQIDTICGKFSEAAAASPVQESDPEEQRRRGVDTDEISE